MKRFLIISTLFAFVFTANAFDLMAEGNPPLQSHSATANETTLVQNNSVFDPSLVTHDPVTHAAIYNGKRLFDYFSEFPEIKRLNSLPDNSVNGGLVLYEHHENNGDLLNVTSYIINPDMINGYSSSDAITAVNNRVPCKPGDIINLYFTLTRNNSKDFTNIQFDIHFNGGIRPMYNTREEGYGWQGADIHNFLFFSDNCDNTYGTYPTHTIVGINLSKKPVYYNPCALYAMTVKIPETITTGTYLMTGSDLKYTSVNNDAWMNTSSQVLCVFDVSQNVKATGISLNKNSLSLINGQSETLSATITPSNTTNKGVTWRSFNPAVAAVDSYGMVTGIAPGTTTITATTADGTNLSASCQVTVKMLATGISLNKSSLTLNDGQTETLVATVTPSNTSNKNVTWKSSNTAIATVDSYGRVSGIAPGTTTITATTADGTNISASCQVTVKMLAKGISLNKSSLTLNDGQAETLVATVTPSNTSNKSVTWKSSNTAVATVTTSGKVTGVAPGTATITATTADGTNISTSCQVTVKMLAKGISLNKSSLTLNDGQTETLVATVTPSNTSNKNVTWRSSNTAIATVDSYGRVTGIAPGTTTITATTADGSNISTSCQVTVRMLAKGISLNKSSLTLINGQTEMLVATVTPSNTTNKSVTWTSSNNSVATVDANGYVTAISLGTATITATTTDGTNLSASCQVSIGISAQEISLNKNVLSLYDGQSETLVATIFPSNATNKIVLWRSSNTNIAIVDNNGNVTGVAAGTATITATTTDGTNLSASCQVNVLTKAKGISLNKSSLTLNDGQTATLVATVTPSNASNKVVTWHSSDTDIATVDANGKVTAIEPGTVNITATTTDGTYLSATCQVTVYMKAKGISLNKATLSLEKGQTETLVATITPSNTSDKSLTWHSSNTSVVTVDSYGNVTGVGDGTATITATTNDGTYLSASCQVTVTVKATGIRLSSSSITIDEEKSTTLYATITPYNTANQKVTWTSANPNIATVDSYGRVTGVTFGETTIIATTSDGTNLSDSCQVTVVVKKLYSETIDFFGGEEVTIPVKMRNSMEISGFQTEIYLPNEFSFAMDEDRIPEISLSDRASRNHTIAATSLSDTNKAIRVLSYSNTSKEYNGNDGDLFYFTLKSDWDTPIDTYYVTLDNSKLAKPDGEQLNIDGTSIKLRCFYVPGDANHDKKVSISDIIADARYILLQNPEPFHYKSANVNDDREISVADIVLTSNIILGRYQTDDKKYSVQRLMGNNSLSASVVESRRDGSRTIAIALDNTSDYTAFQADMVLPNGMEIINARLSDRAGRSHTVSMNRIGGNSVRLLSYATDNAVFAGNSGELLFLDVKGSGDIDITNALFCEPNGCEHELDNISFSTELSGISDITVGNGPINVYNMAGQLLRKNVNEENATQNLPAGIYLVGNKKVVVK